MGLITISPLYPGSRPGLLMCRPARAFFIVAFCGFASGFTRWAGLSGLILIFGASYWWRDKRPYRAQTQSPFLPFATDVPPRWASKYNGVVWSHTTMMGLFVAFVLDFVGYSLT